MATNSRLSRVLQLQRIANTSRKLNQTAHSKLTIRPKPNVPIILESLPKHRPLLPLLLSHDIPSKLAKACADKFDIYADKLKSETETKLVPYLLDHSSGPPARVYSLFLHNYGQALRDSAQSTLNAALKSLKRSSAGLGGWDVTYPPPLSLPLPLDSTRMREGSQILTDTVTSSPLSPVFAPSHAFPTPYPPPHRPPSELPPVEWLRVPTASSSSLAPAIDLDSLCLRFEKSLVIDENPLQPSQSKASIFSVPAVLKDGRKAGLPRVKAPKRKLLSGLTSRGLPASKSDSVAPPLKTATSRQLSVPPSFLLPSPKARSSLRKASAPARVSALPKLLDLIPHGTQTTSLSPLDDSTPGDLQPFHHPGPSPPLSPQFSFNSTSYQTTYNMQGLPYPTKPPVFSQDPFPRPVIVPSTPVHLSPGSSLMPIIDPFHQFQLQCDHFLSASLDSPFDYIGSTPWLTTGGFLSKSAFDTPLGFDRPSSGIPAPIMPEPYENLLNSYAVF